MTTITAAREAGLATIAGDSRITAVYYALPFGEVVVVPDGTVYLAEDYDRAHGGR